MNNALVSLNISNVMTHLSLRFTCMITILSCFASCAKSAIGLCGMYSYNVDARLYGIPAYSLSFLPCFLCLSAPLPHNKLFSKLLGYYDRKLLHFHTMHNNFDTAMKQYSLTPDVSRFHGIIVFNSQLFPVLNKDE